MTCRHSNAIPLEKGHLLSTEERKSLHRGDHAFAQCIRCRLLLPFKVNGSPKVWKRSPEKVHISYKYGLYEYGVFTESAPIYKEKT